jgi:hypothetical protein
VWSRWCAVAVGSTPSVAAVAGLASGSVSGLSIGDFLSLLEDIGFSARELRLS